MGNFFKFSPSLGLLGVGGIWGVSRLRKTLKVRKAAKDLAV